MDSTVSVRIPLFGLVMLLAVALAALAPRATLSDVGGAGQPAAGGDCWEDGCSELAHFVAYGARFVPKAVSVEPMLIQDQFGSASYWITRPRRILLPADKILLDGSETVVADDPDTHLEEYSVRRLPGQPGFAAIQDVRVVNQCNDLFLQVKRPTTLLVPTSKSLTGPIAVPDPNGHLLDYFVCYRVNTQTRLNDGTPVAGFPRGTQIRAIDQFQDRIYDLKRVRELCVPANSGEDPNQAPLRPDHLLCYQAKPARNEIPQAGCGCDTELDPRCRGTRIDPRQAKHVARAGFLNNQFGPGHFLRTKQRRFCIPSFKSLTPPDPNQPVCPQNLGAALTAAVDPEGNDGELTKSLPTFTTLQAAIDSALDGALIGVYGRSSENVLIDDPNRSLTILECQGAELSASDPNLPVLGVTPTAGATLVVSLDFVGATAAPGLRIEGDGHEFRSIRANGNRVGIELSGNANRVSLNNVEGNGETGVLVTGADNDVRGGRIEANSGAGVLLDVGAERNVLSGVTIRSNGGWGVVVSGDGNTVRSNSRIDSNGLGGVLDTGSANTIKDNEAESNTGPGYALAGTGGVIGGNKAFTNSFEGFLMTGGGYGLSGNQSGRSAPGAPEDNGGCEYLNSGSGNLNVTANQANGSSVPGAPGPFPAGCSGTP